MARFEELRVWTDSRLIVNEIYLLMKNCNDFDFKNQIQRAAVSIMNNIAEGSEAGTDSMYVRYLNIAKGSCAEVKSMLYLCEDMNICNKEKADFLRDKISITISGLQKFIIYLSKDKHDK